MSTQERHEAAVEQTLSWAKEAAERGDLFEACSWIATVEVVNGSLPKGWDALAERWRAQLRADP